MTKKRLGLVCNQNDHQFGNINMVKEDTAYFLKMKAYLLDFELEMLQIHHTLKGIHVLPSLIRERSGISD